MLYFGIDTEFLSSGKIGEPHVHCIQISEASDPKLQFFFCSPEELERWFRAYKPNMLFTWTSRAEFGSLKAWGFIGADPYDDSLDRVQRFYLEWRGIRGGAHRTLIYDVQPYFKTLRYKGHGLGTLAAIGDFLTEFYEEDLQKLEHPLGDEFGARAPETPEEWNAMRMYGLRDARICAKAGQWFFENIVEKYLNMHELKFLKRLFSWGTVSRYYFKFPKLWTVKYYGRGKKTVQVSAEQMDIHRNATFAGRNESFWTGRVPRLYYNDIASLYPCATIWTNALDIRPSLEALSKSELERISKSSDFQSVTGAPYGWLCGDFTTESDVWGLPIRSETLGRNYYVIGTVPNHLYHIYDLLAAKARINTLYYGYKPVFYDNPEQQRYIDLTLKKLERRYANEAEKNAIKGVLNAATGKLGQAKPISATSNFASYSTILAASHYIDSKIFDKIDETIFYTDTDSFFCKHPINKTMLTLENERYGITVPIRVELRAQSDEIGTLLFRSKHYFQSSNSYTIHAWKWFLSDWLEIIRKMPEEVNVRRQIARTFRTRDKKALEMQIGRWKTLKERFDLEKLTRLFHADDKRVRTEYNSYRLARENQAVGSRAWTFRELQLYMASDRSKKYFDIEADPLHPKIVPRDYIIEWIRLHPDMIDL